MDLGWILGLILFQSFLASFFVFSFFKFASIKIIKNEFDFKSLFKKEGIGVNFLNKDTLKHFYFSFKYFFTARSKSEMCFLS